MELPAVTVLASKNVNAGAAGAWVVLAAEQQGGGMWMRCDWIEGGVVYFSRKVQCQNPIVRRTQIESRESKVKILSIIY